MPLLPLAISTSLFFAISPGHMLFWGSWVLEGRYAKKSTISTYSQFIIGEIRDSARLNNWRNRWRRLDRDRDRGREATKGRSQAGEGEKQLEHVAKLISNDRSELRCTMQIAERGNQGTTQQRLITRLWFERGADSTEWNETYSAKKSWAVPFCKWREVQMKGIIHQMRIKVSGTNSDDGLL